MRNRGGFCCKWWASLSGFKDHFLRVSEIQVKVGEQQTMGGGGGGGGVKV